MVDGIIKRHNDRHESLIGRSHNDSSLLFKSREGFIVNYIENRCIAAKLVHPTLTQRDVTRFIDEDPNTDAPNYKVDACFAKFRHVLCERVHKTKQIDVYVHCKIVIQAMKDVHDERAQAKQLLFPNDVVEG